MEALHRGLGWGGGGWRVEGAIFKGPERQTVFQNKSLNQTQTNKA